LQPLDEINRKLSEVISRISNCTALDARAFIQHIDDCTMQHARDPNLFEHCKDCHLDADAYGSKLLYLRQLSPHFPSIRRIVSMVYTIRKANKHKGDRVGLCIAIGRCLSLAENNNTTQNTFQKGI